MNCHSNLETVNAIANKKGACLSIATLKAPRKLHHPGNQSQIMNVDGSTDSNSMTAVRTVDFDFNPAPMHALFTRIEHGNWYQFVGSRTNLLQPNFDAQRDLHPRTVVMNVPAFYPVIIIWRSRTLVDQ